jgi:hypothetical protein
VHDVLNVGGKVIVATDAGIFSSTDLATWTPVSGLELRAPQALTTDGTTLWVGTNGFGLYATPLP